MGSHNVFPKRIFYTHLLDAFSKHAFSTHVLKSTWTIKFYSTNIYIIIYLIGVVSVFFLLVF